MGASGSKVGPLRPAASQYGGEETFSYVDGIEPPWPLPGASQDAIWTKVQLSTILEAGTVLQAAGGWGTGGADVVDNLRNISNQAARSSRHGAGLENDDDSEDWLEAGLCLSKACLPPEDMAMLVERAKGQLLRRLSRLCDQDDVFCEVVMQRIHALYCAHAAMTRRLVLEAKRVTSAAAEVGPARTENSQQGAKPPVGRLDDCLEPTGNARLGLQLFFSLLDFVQDPECGQEQLADFLRQIVPVLSGLPQLCLANDYRCTSNSGQTTKATQPTPGVVPALRTFLVRCIVPPTRSNGIRRAGTEKRGEHGGQEAHVVAAEQRDRALSALVSLAAARGRASDLLVLVKVLLDVSIRGDAHVRDEAVEEPAVFCEGDQPHRDHVLQECNAKRCVASRTRVMIQLGFAKKWTWGNSSPFVMAALGICHWPCAFLLSPPFYTCLCFFSPATAVRQASKIARQSAEISSRASRRWRGRRKLQGPSSGSIERYSHDY